MTAEASQARRLRRPTWRDPRLGVGVLLVAGSVALGTWAVRDAAGTVEVYAARDVLTPGDPVGADDLLVREVRLGTDEALYQLVEDGPPGDLVAVRAVGAGELVPRSAVGPASAVALRPVVVPLGLSVPDDVTPGGVVDLWLAPPADLRGTATEVDVEPVLLAEDLVVAQVSQDDSMFTGGTGTSVELLVPEADLPDVLAALSDEGQLVAVPTFARSGAQAPTRAPEDEPSTGAPGLDVNAGPGS